MSMGTGPLDPRAMAKGLTLTGRAALASGQAPVDAAPPGSDPAAESRRLTEADSYASQATLRADHLEAEALPWDDGPAADPQEEGGLDAFTSADAANNARDVAPELRQGTKAAASMDGAGKALGAVAAVSAFNDLTDALKAEPINWDAALGALGNGAMGLEQMIGEMGGTAGSVLSKLGGIGAVVGGLASLRERIETMRAGGEMDTAAVAGLIADGLQVLGGAATLLAPVCPPLGAAAGALYIASAGANLVAFAAENWDSIERGAAAVGEAIGDRKSVV